MPSAEPAAASEPLVSKTTCTYWNPLDGEQQHRWRWLEGLEGQVEELILSHDSTTGEFTRLTRFHPGSDTSSFGATVHAYPEEILIVSGRLWDAAFGMWLDTGHYASRPSGEVHGPFRSDAGCVVLDVSFPQRQDHGVDLSPEKCNRERMAALNLVEPHGHDQ